MGKQSKSFKKQENKTPFFVKCALKECFNTFLRGNAHLRIHSEETKKAIANHQLKEKKKTSIPQYGVPQ